MIKSKRFIFTTTLSLILIFALFGFFYGKQRPQSPLKATSLKLNTVVTVTLYEPQDQEILDRAMALCDEYEKIFSRTSPDSELYKLNSGQLAGKDGFSVLSKPLAELTESGLSYSSLSQGSFDISVAPVSELWDFTSGKGKAPAEKDLKDAVKLVDYRKVFLENGKLRFEQEGMGLDLGAIAKGYIADRIKDFLISEGVKSAVIDLGGNVLCVGDKPDGSPFRIGIQKPFADRKETVAAVEVSGRSVVSSGIYERYFEDDGVLYHHLLDPKTGYPYDNGLISVTVLTDKSVDGDGLSTSAFALGLEKGMELIDSIPDVQAIFITEDGEMHFSEKFEEEVSIIYKEEEAG